MPPIDQSFLFWLAGLSLFVFLVNQGMTFWKTHLAEQPRPSATYATKREFGDLRREFSEMSTDIDNKFQSYEARLEKTINDMELRRSQNVARLHEKIDQSNDELRREIKGDMNGHGKRLDALLAEVSRLSGKLES